MLLKRTRYWTYAIVSAIAAAFALVGFVALQAPYNPMLFGLVNICALALSVGFVIYIVGQLETRSSARLAAIVQSSDDIIISKNLDGIITSWNPAAESILGFAAEEAIGQHISLIIPKERLSEEDQIISNIRAGRRLSHFETIRRRKDGTPIELSITVSPIKDKKGRIIGASKIARDISERKAHEIALAEERETLETLNKLTPKIASTLDLKSLVQLVTDEATRLIGANFGAFFYNVVSEEGKAFQLFTLSGAPREAFEKLGMPRETELFTPTFSGQGTVLSDDILEDLRYRRGEGMPRGHLPVRSYLATPVISRGGEVIGGLFFGHRDAAMFTERDARLAEGIAALAAVGIDNARLYDQVIANQKKAEEASMAKSDFLATMSHEIRTPLNAIVGLAHILESMAMDTQKEYISTLKSAADSLLVLINDLLDISRIESQGFDLERRAFKPAVLCEEVHKLLSVKAQEKNISFVVETEAVKNLTFEGDEARLRQVINNLCGNALKFTEKGGVLLKATLGGSSDATSLIITVRDTGIGISPEKREIIFEKFVQADTSINRKYGGTGLGLSITKALVDMMGGSISLESIPGSGSIFVITLPMKLVHDTSEGETLVEKDSQRNESISAAQILLVEDYEPNVIVAAAFLDMFGYSYDVAKNGLEATDKVKHKAYDALLMDLQMPGMNGFEATKVIRSLDRKEIANIPIIGMTAHAMAGDREKCLEAGMDDYISKPFNPQDLQEKLAQAVSKARLHG